MRRVVSEITCRQWVIQNSSLLKDKGIINNGEVVNFSRAVIELFDSEEFAPEVATTSQ